MSIPALKLTDVQKYANSSTLMQRLIEADNASPRPDGIANDFQHVPQAIRAQTEFDYFEVVNSRNRARISTLVGTVVLAADAVGTFLVPQVGIPLNLLAGTGFGVGWLATHMDQ